MNHAKTIHLVPPTGFIAAAVFLFVVLITVQLASGAQSQIDGFTEPSRMIELASDETGCIAELLVEVGDHVLTDQPIARLDDRLQQVQLEMAQHLAHATSSLQSAEQTYSKRSAAAQRIASLRENGHASESEKMRSELELMVAQSRYQAAQEEHAARKIELRRAEIQLQRRTIKAPFAGVVAKIHRHPGEYLSPLRPEIITLIQNDSLIAVFNVPSDQVASLEVGQEVPVVFKNRESRTGIIQSIAVETEPQSGTVLVKVLLDNADLTLRSGEHCVLQLR